ncbi:MAG: P1 family peptidase [Deltaproteobacteria bacterium]|nr:P1 family peptidase [Deltaproteobacteria bacterium]
METRWLPDGSPASVSGFSVGQANHPAGPSGVTVVLCPGGAVGGVHLAGSAPGTRGMDSLRPGHLVRQVHGVLFTGGSSFGLAAVDGALAQLAAQGVGIDLGPARLPILPAAVIFDLPLAGGRAVPDAELGRQACLAAGQGPLARGNFGAGAGATVGKLHGLAQAMKGGVGGAALAVGGLRVGALAVVNAFGDVLDETGAILAGARRAPDSREFTGTSAWFLAGGRRLPGQAAGNTTLAVVTTNARLDREDATKVAQLAQHGLVRTIDPVNTTLDGDLVCVLAAGDQEADVNGLGVMAAAAVARAIRDAVRAAQPLPDLPAAGA